MTWLVRKPRNPRLAARPDGVRVRCGNMACGRNIPGLWLVPLADHELPVAVVDRAWEAPSETMPRAFSVERNLVPRLPTTAFRLDKRIAKDRDFVSGRRRVSRYTAHRGPLFRGCGWGPFVCPHCGSPLSMPPTATCRDCMQGRAHERALYNAWSAVLD